jgi:alpha/beta superfamily hydrolase
VFIPVAHGQLEAHFRPAEGEPRAAAVVCHPHPLHGGTMHTKAVFRAAQALNEAGIHALRFNFRGVGTSTGSHGGGLAEQEDVRAALDWLEGSYPGLPLVLGGFSFGSVVALHVGLHDPSIQALFAMGVPLHLPASRQLYLPDLTGVTKPVLVVQGEEDEFGSGAEVAAWGAPFGDRVQIHRVAGAGHFFHDHFEELKEAIRTFFLTDVLTEVPR